MTLNEIAPVLIEAADQIRVFHWAILGFSEHKALGELYDAVSDSTDEIVETLIGVEDKAPSFAVEIKLSDYSPGAAEKYVQAFADELASWSGLPSDILNMRDDLLGKVHHALYMLRLK